MNLRAKKEKKAFLRLLKKVGKKYTFILHAFNIMDNHIHLLIEPLEDTNLSKIMQWLLSLFARDWNKRHNTCGHFWGDRFYSEIIEDEEHFKRLLDYIEDNAVRAGLVDSKEKWLYSSFHERITGVFNLITPLQLFEYG